MVKNITQDNIVELSPLYLFRWEEPQQAHILLYPEGVVKLNETGAAIIKYCDGNHTVKEVCAQLGELYTSDVSESVHKFLEVSYAKGWIRIKS
jgi:pyrroloquinoline quinone biosynthesis protein D